MLPFEHINNSNLRLICWLFISNITTISAELGNRISTISYDKAMNECQRWVFCKIITKKGSGSGKICNYDKKPNHIKADYRKKKAAVSNSNTNKKAPVKVIAVGQEVQGFQLDIGSDKYIAGNLKDLSDYITDPHVVKGAGNTSIIVLGHRKLIMPGLVSRVSSPCLKSDVRSE